MGNEVITDLHLDKSLIEGLVFNSFFLTEFKGGVFVIVDAQSEVALNLLGQQQHAA